MHLMLVSVVLPPNPDGIGDYTARLATQLAADGHDVTVVCCRGAQPAEPIDNVTIAEELSPRGWRAVGRLRGLIDELDSAGRRPDTIVLQFNPFSWGRWGFNPRLALTLQRIKRAWPGMPVAVMFHETFVPPLGAKFHAMRLWQLPGYRAVADLADARFFSIQRWAEQEAARRPDKPTSHLPVGSNLPRSALTREEARQPLGLTPDDFVAGVFGGAHPSRLVGHAAAAAAATAGACPRLKLLVVGTAGPSVKEELRSLGCDMEIIDRGYQPAEATADAVAAMDVLLSPFVDGVSTRRGSAMAALQHGVPLLTTAGISTDDAFAAEGNHSLVMTEAEDKRAFAAAAVQLASDPPLRQQVGSRGRELYRRCFDWPVVASRLVENTQTASTPK